MVALITWVAWAVLTLQTRCPAAGPDPLRYRRDDAHDRVCRRAGPLQVFGMIPGVMLPVFAITIIWMFAAMVVAIQHALDYTNVGRAGRVGSRR